MASTDTYAGTAISCPWCGNSVKVAHGIVVQCGTDDETHFLRNYGNSVYIWDDRCRKLPQRPTNVERMIANRAIEDSLARAGAYGALGAYIMRNTQYKIAS